MRFICQDFLAFSNRSREWLLSQNICSLSFLNLFSFIKVIFCAKLPWSVTSWSVSWLIFTMEYQFVTIKKPWSDLCKLGIFVLNTVRKVSKYGVFSGPYFPAFGPNTEIYLHIWTLFTQCSLYQPVFESEWNHWEKRTVLLFLQNLFSKLAREDVWKQWRMNCEKKGTFPTIALMFNIKVIYKIFPFL